MKLSEVGHFNEGLWQSRVRMSSASPFFKAWKCLHNQGRFTLGYVPYLTRSSFEQIGVKVNLEVPSVKRGVPPRWDLEDRDFLGKIRRIDQVRQYARWPLL